MMPSALSGERIFFPLAVNCAFGSAHKVPVLFGRTELPKTRQKIRRTDRPQLVADEEFAF